MNTALNRCLGVVLGIMVALPAKSVGPAFAAADGLTPRPWAAARAELFPVSPQLAPAVTFWQRCFAQWHRRQVALHDSEYLGVIYEVFELPGDADERQSDAQRSYVDQRRRELAADLTLLQSRVRYQLPLDSRQQQLYQRIQTGGGVLFGASDRVRSQRGMQERFRDGIAISGRYDAMIRQIFHREGLPEDLAYLPHVESSFQSAARSAVGAAGVWQFMPAAARLHMRMNAAVDERYDPILAAQGAANYLADAHRQLGDWGLAITSYNHGVAGMRRAQEEYGRDIGRIVQSYRGPAFGFSSRNFYAEFLAVRGIMNDLKRFFPAGVVVDAPMQLDRIQLQQAMRVSQLADFFRLPPYTLERLNPALTHAALTERCSLPTYTEVWLPKGTLATSPSLLTYRAPIEPETEVLEAIIPVRNSAERLHVRKHTHPRAHKPRHTPRMRYARRGGNAMHSVRTARHPQSVRLTAPRNGTHRARRLAAK